MAFARPLTGIRMRRGGLTAFAVASTSPITRSTTGIVRGHFTLSPAPAQLLLIDLCMGKLLQLGAACPSRKALELMQRIETSFPGVVELRPAVHRDARGFFIETYHKAKLADLGIADVFVQDNH